MKTSDLLSMCVKNLTRRKFRTAMTVIGVVIGTCAIISMISLGIGINKSTSDFISSWGDLSTIEVWQGGPDVLLTDETVAQILAIDGVDVATPFMRLPIYEGKMQAGKNGRYSGEIWRVPLTGVYPEALDKMGYHLSEGELMKSGTRRIQVVAGSLAAFGFIDTKKRGPDAERYPWPDEEGNIPEPFFDITETDDLQLIFTYDGDKEIIYDIDVVGVLDSDNKDAMEVQTGIFMDVRDMGKLIEDFRKISKSRDKTPFTYDQVRVKANDLEKVGAITKELEEMTFSYYSMEKQRQDAMAQTQLMQMILGSLGGISLFVAAISIANTMVMSVYERTREIGIMKVLGCFVSDIRTTFLVEASMIGFGGGVIGVLLSYLISYLLNKFGASIGEAMGMINYDGTAQLSIIPPWLVLLGLGFATGVGIISGIYPAARAVKISTLEAIKQE